MIPNRFHFIFGLRKQTEPFHLVHYLALKSCLEVNRPESIRLYYHYMPYGPYWDLIRPHLELVPVQLNPTVAGFEYADKAIAPYRYAHQSDFIRLEQLLASGGVYADIDTLFVHPLPAHLYTRQFVIGKEGAVFDTKTGKREPSLCNALLMAEPGSEFARLWLNSMAAEFDGSWSNHSTLFPFRLSRARPELVHVEPQSSFFHFSASAGGLISLFEDLQPIPANAYNLHLWEHLWWSRRRRDFSRMHAGLLTEEFIAKGDTTYTRAARAFLPPPDAARRGGARHLWQDIATKAADRFDDAIDDARSLAGRMILPLVQKVKPGAGGRLDLARAHHAYRRSVRRLRPRNRLEQSILRWVIQWDEYSLFDTKLRPEDVVVDIGGHIGSFTYICHWQGSRNIHTFEPLPANFAHLEGNFGSVPGIHLHCRAIFRSDGYRGAALRHSGPVFENTGGGNVIFGGRPVDLLSQSEQPAVTEAEPAAVEVTPLDEVLSRFERVRLMKVDCEGSEFPILLTSRELHRVDRIVGEYHEIAEELMPLLDPAARLDGITAYRRELLGDCLTKAGFQVEFHTESEVHGRFEGIRAH